MITLKKNLILISVLLVATTCMSFGAKYKVNTSGTVKNQSGTVLTSPSNFVNQQYYTQTGVNGSGYSNSVIDNSGQYFNNAVQNSGSSVYGTVSGDNASAVNNSPQLVDNFFRNYQAQSYIANNQVNSVSVGIVEFVMDYSGSMSNWIEVAKRSMSAILAQLPSTTKVGFRVFGHDNYGKNPNNSSTVRDIKKIVKQGKKLKVITEKSCLGTTSGACSATKLVAPIANININSLISGMNSVGLGGATPLVYALDRAANQDLAAYDTTTPKKIVLITDGGENCGGDPCAFAAKLMQKRSDIHIDVVLVSSNSKSLSCLSNTTGGHFYTVNDLSDFSTVINQSMKSQPAVQPQSHDQKYEYIGD